MWNFVKEKRKELGEDPIPESEGKIIDNLVKYTVDVDHFQHLFWDELSPQEHNFSLYQVMDSLKDFIPSDRRYALLARHILDSLVNAEMNKQSDIKIVNSNVDQWMESSIRRDDRIANMLVWARIQLHLHEEKQEAEYSKQFTLKEILLGLQTTQLSDDEFGSTKEKQKIISEAVRLYMAKELMPSERYISEVEKKENNKFITNQGRKGLVIEGMMNKEVETAAYRKGYDIVIMSKDNHAKVHARPVNKHLKEKIIDLTNVHLLLLANDPARFKITKNMENDILWFLHPKKTIVTNDDIYVPKRLPTELPNHFIKRIVMRAA